MCLVSSYFSPQPSLFVQVMRGKPESLGMDCYCSKVGGKLGNIGAEIPKLYGFSDK